MSLAGEAVVSIWHGIAPEGRDAFYAWHVHEHMPERVGIPGFLRGRRYIAERGGPEFFTLYEASTVEVLGGSGRFDGATGTGTLQPKYAEGYRGSYTYEFQITTP